MRIVELAEALGRKVKEYVANALAPVVERIAALELQTKGLPDLVKQAAREAALTPLPGEPGKDGKDGKSVTPEEVKQLVDAAVGQIPRPKDGDPGKDGKSVDLGQVRGMINELLERIPAPKDGKDGKDGTSVDVAQVKAMLEDLVAKLPKPKDGEPGLDALAIAPLAGIDETKSYRRGTWAAHRGGLIRAERATDPIGEKTLEECGWSVILEGVAALLVTQGEKNARQFIVSSVLTSGKAVAVDFLVPVMINRGVYKDDAEYELGDVVTWAGAMWHRDGLGKGVPGTAGSGWTLCVKKGRDGK